jgi:hypothetical protein
MLFNPLIEGELRFGTARSYGVELLLKKSEGKFSGWIGYSYSKSLKTIEGVNKGDEFPAYYDHPHSLFANLLLKAGKRWDIAANWFYMTGSAFTSPTGFMQYNGYVVPIYGVKNNDRYPDYHRLDISVSGILSFLLIWMAVTRSSQRKFQWQESFHQSITHLNSDHKPKNFRQNDFQLFQNMVFAADSITAGIV